MEGIGKRGRGGVGKKEELFRTQKEGDFRFFNADILLSWIPFIVLIKKKRQTSANR